MRSALGAHLATLRELGHAPNPKAEIAVIRVTTFRRLGATRKTLSYAGLGALLGRRTSEAKTVAASTQRTQGRASVEGRNADSAR